MRVYICVNNPSCSAVCHWLAQCDVCVSPFVQWYPNKDGCTPLWIAAANGRLHVVKYLFTEAKADPNQPNKVMSGSYDVCDRDVCVCVCLG